MLFFRKKKEGQKKLVGLKIGYRSCRVIELSEEKRGLSLTNYGEIIFPLFTPPQSVVGLEELGPKSYSQTIEPFPPPEIMAKNLAYLFERTNIKEKNIFLSIPSFLFFISTLEVPSLPPEKIPSYIREEIKKYVSFSLDDCLIDWQLTEGKISFLGTQKSVSRILTYVILNENLAYFKKISQLLNVNFLPTPDFFSLLRLLSFEKKTLAIEQNRVYGLLYVDDEYALFLLFKNNLPLYVWPIEIRTIDGLEKIMEYLGLSFQMAEEIRKRLGVNQDAPQEVKNALLSLFENLMIEVQKRIKEFEQKKLGKIEDVFLTGPGIFTAGFVDTFQFFTEKKGKILPFPQKVIVPENLESFLPEIISYFSLPFGSIKSLEKI